MRESTRLWTPLTRSPSRVLALLGVLVVGLAAVGVGIARASRFPDRFVRVEWVDAHEAGAPVDPSDPVRAGALLSLDRRPLHWTLYTNSAYTRWWTLGREHNWLHAALGRPRWLAWSSWGDVRQYCQIDHERVDGVWYATYAPWEVAQRIIASRGMRPRPR